MVGVEDRNEDVAEEEAPGPSSVSDAAAPAPVPAPSAEDGGVIFVLEKASLEAAKVGKNYQLLNCDDHATFLKKHKRDPALYRPDILHQDDRQQLLTMRISKSKHAFCIIYLASETRSTATGQALLAILDSTLNKAGRLKGLYVHTEKNVLIQINPHIRIPRTFKRFCGLMLQLLQKLSIRASNGPDKLMRIVKQPVTRYLPLGARRIGMSYSAPKVVQLSDYVAAAGLSSTYVFVVGAMAHGKIDVDYIDDLVAVSEYPLSAMWCIARICSSFEQQWHIL